MVWGAVLLIVQEGSNDWFHPGSVIALGIVCAIKQLKRIVVSHHCSELEDQLTLGTRSDVLTCYMLSTLLVLG